MVAKVLNLNSLSWQRQPFALSNNGRKGYSFVPECNHAQEKSYMSFLSFFSAMFAVPQTVEIKKFCYLVNMM